MVILDDGDLKRKGKSFLGLKLHCATYGNGYFPSY